MKKPLEVFCCYAREDQSLLVELKKHLSQLGYEGLIKVWADVDINAGSRWEQEIEKHLTTAQIILLLVSPDFMASDYCYSKEMTLAMERYECGEARVIPIILRPTDWRNTPFAKLQVLPTNAVPVTSWPTRDDGFFDVTTGIRGVVEELRTITKLLESLTENPQCAWIAKWDPAVTVSEIKLNYDSTINYESTMPDDVRQALEDWCGKNEKQCKDKQRDPMGTLVRLEQAEWRHLPYKYFVNLSPSKYLFYVAIHPHLGKAELRWLRENHFDNALLGLKNDSLALPSNFALHMAVVSQDGYLLLRQRAGEEKTALYPSAWEAGIGEFMHGPEDMPGPEYESGSYHSEFPHFTKDGTPDLFLFLRNAVAEELGYRGARQEDFRLYGFAVEYETLAPKLLVIYNSDCPIKNIKESAKDKKKAPDSSPDVRGIPLTLRGIVEAYSNPAYNTKWGWGPTSKLVMLLALKQDLETKGMEDQSSIKELIDCFNPKMEGGKPVDPWKFHE